METDMKAISYSLVFAMLLAVSGSAWSKSQTIKLEIVGPGLVSPIEITDRAIIDLFSIWSGPGSTPSGSAPIDLEQNRAFIDWSRGIVQQPVNPTLYTVTFHQGGREQMHEYHKRYVVTYAYDPASAQGYIYLPGPKDGDVYKRNVFSIVHDIEGNWFYASPNWERYVRPLIRKAATSGAAN